MDVTLLLSIFTTFQRPQFKITLQQKKGKKHFRGTPKWICPNFMVSSAFLQTENEGPNFNPQRKLVRSTEKIHKAIQNSIEYFKIAFNLKKLKLIFFSYKSRFIKWNSLIKKTLNNEYWWKISIELFMRLNYRHCHVHPIAGK